MGTLRRWPAMAASLGMVALLTTACDDRQERIEQEAAPGMEAGTAAPESGPADIEVQPTVPTPSPGDTLMLDTLPPDTMPGTIP